MTSKNNTYRCKIAILKFWQLCCFLILPILGFGQETKDFQFYNQTGTEILENYYLTIFENETINNFFPNEKHKISIAKETILKSDSIHLNANFQTIKLSKTDFNTETINVELSLSLDEVVIHDKKEKYWIGAEGELRYGLSITHPVIQAIKLDSTLPSRVIAVEIHIKGGSIFTPRSYKSRFQLLLYIADKNLNLVEKLTNQDLFYSVRKRGSHKLNIDLREYNLQIDEGKYIIIEIKKLSENLTFKLAPAKKNKSSIKLNKFIKRDSVSNKKIIYKKQSSQRNVMKLRVQLEKI